MRVVRVCHAGRDAAHRERDRALVAAGAELTLVVPRAWPGADAVTAEPFEIVEVDVHRPGDVNRHRLREPGVLADLVRARRPDVVDLHEEPFSAVVHQSLDVLPPGQPVVAYAAQNIDKRFPPPFAHWERAALRRLDALYPCSRQAASVAVAKGFRGAVDVLPLAASQEFTPGTQDLGSGPVRLLHVGRLVPEKGVLDAVRVAALLAPAWPVRLTVVGDGPEAGQARGLATHLGVPLTVHPWLAPTDLAQHYRAAHVLLAPSRATSTWVEQFGRMVVEARAAGCVVAGYTSGALPEVVGDTGVLVPTGDVSGLAGAVALLLADPHRWRNLRAAGLAAAAAGGWDAVAARQLHLYRAALAGRADEPVGRAAARARWGPTAAASTGERPFALPVLRDGGVVAGALAAVLDAASAARRAR